MLWGPLSAVASGLESSLPAQPHYQVATKSKAYQVVKSAPQLLLLLPLAPI